MCGYCSFLFLCPFFLVNICTSSSESRASEKWEEHSMRNIKWDNSEKGSLSVPWGLHSEIHLGIIPGGRRVAHFSGLLASSVLSPSPLWISRWKNFDVISMHTANLDPNIREVLHKKDSLLFPFNPHNPWFLLFILFLMSAPH